MPPSVKLCASETVSIKKLCVKELSNFMHVSLKLLLRRESAPQGQVRHARAILMSSSVWVGVRVGGGAWERGARLQASSLNSMLTMMGCCECFQARDWILAQSVPAPTIHVMDRLSTHTRHTYKAVRFHMFICKAQSPTIPYHVSQLWCQMCLCVFGRGRAGEGVGGWARFTWAWTAPS